MPPPTRIGLEEPSILNPLPSGPTISSQPPRCACERIRVPFPTTSKRSSMRAPSTLQKLKGRLRRYSHEGLTSLTMRNCPGRASRAISPHSKVSLKYFSEIFPIERGLTRRQCMANVLNLSRGPLRIHIKVAPGTRQRIFPACQRQEKETLPGKWTIRVVRSGTRTNLFHGGDHGLRSTDAGEIQGIRRSVDRMPL